LRAIEMLISDIHTVIINLLSPINLVNSLDIYMGGVTRMNKVPNEFCRDISSIRNSMLKTSK
jgi:hypothetical protein